MIATGSAAKEESVVASAMSGLTWMFGGTCFFSCETWITGWILHVGGRSSQYATAPTFCNTWNGPKKRNASFWLSLVAALDWMYGWSFRYTRSPILNDHSDRPLSAWVFIRCCARSNCCWIKVCNRSLSLSHGSRSGIEQPAKFVMPKCLGLWPYNTSNGDSCKAEW